MLVSPWCYQSGLLKVIGQLSFNGSSCKVCVKFATGHWLVLIHVLLVISVCWSSVNVTFVYGMDKSFVRHQYLLPSVKRDLLYVSVPAFLSQLLKIVCTEGSCWNASHMTVLIWCGFWWKRWQQNKNVLFHDVICQMWLSDN